MTYPYDLKKLVNPDPPLGFRFDVRFFKPDGTWNPLDTRFKRVSGIGSTIRLGAYQLPEEVTHGNLVLERGLIVNSPLSAKFNTIMSEFKFSPGDVLVSLLDGAGDTISSWLFMKAYPVKWSISDLNADQNEVVIESLELAYRRMQPVRI